ncbi:MAG: ribonuclease P protein component [Flavobacteriaceae bacterium]|nr:ribonuclease P protein component [Flavobacteriaceae bacterium]
MMDFTFNKPEKLKHKKHIEQLFKEGKSLTLFPLRMVYLHANHSGNQILQVGFSVPKRKFKHAVDRNLLKRRMREAYRLNKETIYKVISDKHLLMFIYLDKEIQPSSNIHLKMGQLIQKFIKTIS